METAFDIREIPMAAVPYPTGIWNKIKYIFWRGITPDFLRVRNLLIKLRLVRHAGRQNFILGKLASPTDIRAFVAHLQSQGFGNHFIAWQDDDQLVSLRRLDGFERQYHLRIFKDGEVRGHYEYTPEAHPIRHLKETDMEERRDILLSFVGDWIKRAK